MAEQNCSCCNRTFPSSQLRRHAVGGGVRGVNELLCADCWGVFASAPWDLAGAASPAAEAPAVDTTAPPAVQSGAASGSGAEHADAASSALEHGLLDGRAHAMDAVTRLSGGGGLWQRPVGVSKVPSNESLDHARRMEPDDKLSGVRASGLPSEAAARPEAAEQKPAGPKLKRDRSGRFVSRKQQGAGEADGVGQRPEGPAQALQSTDVPALPEQEDGRGSTEAAAQLRLALQGALQQRADAVEQCAQLQSQVASLETCLRSARLQVLCVMCQADRRSVLALPCGHLLYCASCMAHQRSSSGACGKCGCTITGVHNVSL